MASTAAATITIRPTLYKDLPEILDIYNHYIVHTLVNAWTDAQPLSYIVETYHDVLDQGLPHLVATIKDESNGIEKVLGFSYATQLRPRPAYGHVVELSIYFAPNTTGKGYGSKLLAAIIEALKAVPVSEKRPNGITEVFVYTMVGEKVNNAVNFYLRAGFERNGTLRRLSWKFGRYIDDGQFQLSLGEKDKEEQTQASRGSRSWWVFGPFAWELWRT